MGLNGRKVRKSTIKVSKSKKIERQCELSNRTLSSFELTKFVQLEEMKKKIKNDPSRASNGTAGKNSFEDSPIAPDLARLPLEVEDGSLSNIQDKAKAPEEDSSKKKKTRRSSRLAGKTALAFMMLILLAFPSASAVDIKSVKGSSTLAFQKKQVLIQTGVHLVKIDLDIAEDIRKLKQYPASFEKVCFTIAELNNICAQQLEEIRRTSEFAGNKLQQIQQHVEQRYTNWTDNNNLVLKRSKRGSKGTLVRLWNWLVGTDEASDEEVRSSMGVVRHAIAGFEAVEKHLNQRDEDQNIK
ncbi:CLUMA_CG019284, isoform A [Clunio marinus]|uniref:CLUMA_CG019284, isoform A n=1 Tax=Clunio marinus TaxID=568069 RepID=A0A1J1J3D2_9DIPT|nr:CLUMA_CG019284, isoform A [Clunio marinus]